MGVGPSHNNHHNHDQSREVEEEFDDNGLATACCWFNQRLSPELQLLIFRHLEPQKDSQTVSLVCKYWNELYADEHLWRHFHEREFGRAPVRPPTSFFPDEIYSGAAPTKDGSTSAKQLSWRLSYTYTSSQLKRVFAERRRRIKWLLRFAQITKPTAPDLFFAVHNSLHVLLSRLLLLHSPRTINKAEQHGRSLLFSAAELGDITSVQMLLAHGADPTLSCVCTTPLPVHLTSSTSPSSSLSASPPTLASSPPVSSPPSTSTVSSTFSSFLSSFSSPYPSNYPFTKTSLLVATERGDLDMVCLLLTNGAQPSINCVGFKGHTPLSLAASKGHIEVAKLLLDNGAQVEVPSSSSSSSSHPWIKNPLHRAVLKGHPEIVSLLLRHGADPNKVMCSIRYVPPTFTRAIRSYHGTPLQQLLYKTNEDHLINVRCVELLMEAGASLDPPRDDPWDSVLHRATQRGNIALVRLLVQRGAARGFSGAGNYVNVNAPSSDTRNTPLHLAAQKGDERMVRCLLGCGADPHARNEERATPCEVAYRSGHDRCARLMEEYWWKREGKKNSKNRMTVERVVADEEEEEEEDRMDVEEAAGGERSSRHRLKRKERSEERGEDASMYSSLCAS